MDTVDFSILDDYGIDYEKGISRCMGDEEFYIQVLEMFIEDDAFERAKKALEKKDYRALFECTHELKGVCGNVSMPELYDSVCVIVELLRGGSENEKEIASLFAKVEDAYTKAGSGISLLLGQR